MPLMYVRILFNVKWCLQKRMLVSCANSSAVQLQFEEPEDPEPSMENFKKGLLVGGLKSLVDVSALTDDSNLEINILEDSILCDRNEDRPNDIAVDLDSNHGQFSDNSSDYDKSSPMCSRKDVAFAATPDILSRKLETAPTPKTAETADETLSSGEGKSNSSTENELLLRAPKAFSKIKRSMTVNMDEYDSQQFDLLIQHLSDGEELTKIQVIRNEPTGGRTRTLSELILFFSAIRGLPNLRDLILWNFIPECTDILTSFVSQHPSLQTFHLHYVRGTVDKEFLEALSGIRTIREVVLDLQQDFPFSLLFASQSLRSLKLAGNYYFDNQNFVRAMQILEYNKTLQTLDMKPTFRQLGIRALSHAIEENTALEKLKFSFRATSKSDGGEALLDLAKGLSRNTKLKEVENRRYESVQVAKRDKTRAGKIIASHPTMERFQFYYDSGYIEFNDSVDDNDCQKVSTKAWIAQCGALDACEW
jgi:hypothetical protein